MLGMTRVRVSPTVCAFVFHAKHKLPLITKDMDGTETLHKWENLSERDQQKVCSAILTDDAFNWEEVWGDNLPAYLLEVGFF